jgi:hypothetical protein
VEYGDTKIIASPAATEYVTVPLPGGGSAAIAHRPVSHADKMLGALTSPDGDSASAILQMQEKAQQWVDAVRNGHLHQWNVWFLLGVQFWPWLGFSICNSTAMYDKLEHALQRQYFQILPLGGVIRMVPLDCQMVDAGFYCPGLPHPGVEALTAMTNKLLMHFGCRTALENLLRTSYSLLLLKLGVSFQPLQSLYQQFSFLATHTWMKMLWEKLDKFNITVQTAESPQKFLGRGDKFLMLIFMERGHGMEALIRLNRVRVHLQLIFHSDILSASGLRTDPTVLRRQATGKFHSSMR